MYIGVDPLGQNKVLVRCPHSQMGCIALEQGNVFVYQGVQDCLEYSVPLHSSSKTLFCARSKLLCESHIQLLFELSPYYMMINRSQCFHSTAHIFLSTSECVL